MVSATFLGTLNLIIGPVLPIIYPLELYNGISHTQDMNFIVP
jgi:hypothetical protein